MKGLTAFLFLLHVSVVKPGSHSLWVFSTLIHGQTQFPEFSGVVLVDDLQVLYYDGNLKKLIARGQPSSTTGEYILHQGGNIALKDMYYHMNERFHHIRFLSNHTGGVHVFQRITGCVLDNDKPSPLMMWEVYDGIEVSHHAMHERTVNPLWPQLMLTAQIPESVLLRYRNIYQPVCLRVLKHYLEKEKNVLLRKERPRIRLIRKTCPETGEVKMSCLATGFYPRHINLTMLRDGRPIPDEELILGDVLPNGDGTYQTRRTLGLKLEELRERHQYTCSVTHLTLDNKLNISLTNWETQEGPDVPVIRSVVLLLVLLLILAISAFVIYKRRHSDNALSTMAVGYSLAKVSEETASCPFITRNPLICQTWLSTYDSSLD